MRSDARRLGVSCSVLFGLLLIFIGSRSGSKKEILSFVIRENTSEYLLLYSSGLGPFKLASKCDWAFLYASQVVVDS